MHIGGYCEKPGMTLFTLLAGVVFLLIAGCGSADEIEIDDISADQSVEAVETGTLEFRANGEDFVRNGFVSKDGWHITFNHLYITLTDITAWQSDPPYDSHSDEEIIGEVSVALDGVYTIDLAQGDENADPLSVGRIDSAPVGHYNALSWRMIKASEGPSEGYSIYIDAQAEKGNQSYNVYIGIEQEYLYQAGEYIGDERKGILAQEGITDLEMTFHFDHLFGDGELALDSGLNQLAPGFQPFAGLMAEGTVDVDLSILQETLDNHEYKKLIDILTTLGHVGEGHCRCEVL